MPQLLDRPAGDAGSRQIPAGGPGPVRVLLLNHATGMAGAERSLLDIVTQLDPGRFAFTVALPEARSRLGERLKAVGAEVFAAPLRRFKKTLSLWTLVRYAVNLRRVARQLRGEIARRGIALVHANSNSAQLYGGLAARQAGIPSIWHCRDLVALGPLGPWMFRRCARCIAISDCVADHLSAYAPPPGRLVRIYNGIAAEPAPTDAAGETLRAEFGFAADAFVFAIVGQLVPWKKHALFLEAAARIHRQVPRARFLVLGDDLFADHPGYRNELEYLSSRLGIRQHVVFAGYREDVPRVLRATDALLHCASREPFGRAIAEAMGAGLPVVAVNACGPRELIRDGVDGLLVPPDDPDAMAGAAVRLARDPSLAPALGAAARRRIAQGFSLRAFSDRLTALYEEVLCG